MEGLAEYYYKLVNSDECVELTIRQKAVSKQRPRTGKGGHFFTPKATRDFEKYVAKVAATAVARPFTCPVSVSIIIKDPIPASYKGIKRAAAELNLISPPVGDLDNKCKAITDAMNGIVYVDDRQIKQQHSTRIYGDEYLIRVTVSRAGLSPMELEKFEYGDI